MTGLDTNILARYYLDKQSDNEKTQIQRQIAKEILESNQKFFVAKTVMIEFEWILRGIYKFPPVEVIGVFEHLLTFDNIHFEDKNIIQNAIIFTKKGLEFTDALHLAGYWQCSQVFSFDDKGFAKKVAKYGLKPPIIIPMLRQ